MNPPLGPVPLPVVGETAPPLFQRALQRARIVGNFALVQAIVQTIGFLSGILLVRWLSQPEYAFFTIANTMQGTINLLADIGISVGLVSIGGRVWHDRHRFGELINTALGVRKRLGLAAILIVSPIMYFMLVKNGATNFYSVMLVVIVLIGLAAQFSLGVLGVVPRLRSDVGRIQLIDFTGAIVRLVLLLVMFFLYLNAGIAVFVATLTFVLQYVMMHRYVVGVIDINAAENADDRREIIRLTKHLAANSVFYCFQGQITVFLISFFGRGAHAVAEVGALGRLAMIFAVLSNLLANVFAPAFARCQEPRRLRLLYLGIMGSVLAFTLVIITGATLFPNEFLLILGNKYAHLQRELLLMVGGAVLTALTGAFWTLNASRAWVAGAWLYIPVTVTTQIALIPFTDFSSVSGVLVFNLISAIPNLCLNIWLSLRGLLRFQPVTA
jgi:O-antigen/teichoic acid export membrane protein